MSQYSSSPASRVLRPDATSLPRIGMDSLDAPGLAFQSPNFSSARQIDQLMTALSGAADVFAGYANMQNRSAQRRLDAAERSSAETERRNAILNAEAERQAKQESLALRGLATQHRQNDFASIVPKIEGGQFDGELDNVSNFVDTLVQTQTEGMPDEYRAAYSEGREELIRALTRRQIEVQKQAATENMKLVTTAVSGVRSPEELAKSKDSFFALPNAKLSEWYEAVGKGLNSAAELGEFDPQAARNRYELLAKELPPEHPAIVTSLAKLQSNLNTYLKVQTNKFDEKWGRLTLQYRDDPATLLAEQQRLVDESADSVPAEHLGRMQTELNGRATKIRNSATYDLAVQGIKNDLLSQIQNREMWKESRTSIDVPMPDGSTRPVNVRELQQAVTDERVATLMSNSPDPSLANAAIAQEMAANNTVPTYWAQTFNAAANVDLNDIPGTIGPLQTGYRIWRDSAANRTFVERAMPGDSDIKRIYDTAETLLRGGAAGGDEQRALAQAVASVRTAQTRPINDADIRAEVDSQFRFGGILWNNFLTYGIDNSGDVDQAVKVVARYYMSIGERDANAAVKRATETVKQNSVIIDRKAVFTGGIAIAPDAKKGMTFAKERYYSENKNNLRAGTKYDDLNWFLADQRAGLWILTYEDGTPVPGVRTYATNEFGKFASDADTEEGIRIRNSIRPFMQPAPKPEDESLFQKALKYGP